MPGRASRASSPQQRRRLLGQRIGVAVFSLIFAGATLLWTIQILTAVWGTAPSSLEGCASGTAGLLRAVERARRAQARNPGVADERAALALYRGALQPEWAEQKGVEAACRSDRAGRDHLKDVVALRYAEEHAVRYESLGLAPLRRRLRTIESPE